MIINQCSEQHGVLQPPGMLACFKKISRAPESAAGLTGDGCSPTVMPMNSLQQSLQGTTALHVDSACLCCQPLRHQAGCTSRCLARLSCLHARMHIFVPGESPGTGPDASSKAGPDAGDAGCAAVSEPDPPADDKKLRLNSSGDCDNANIVNCDNSAKQVDLHTNHSQAELLPHCSTSGLSKDRRECAAPCTLSRKSSAALTSTA